MPHTKLKVFSVFLIIFGAGNLLAGVLVLVVSAGMGEEFYGLLSSLLGVSDSVSAAIVAVTAALCFLLAVPELMAGINGFRFANNNTEINFCRIPAMILIVIYILRTVFNIFTWNVKGIVQALIHLAIAVACLNFAHGVEEENRKRPALEDMPLFHIKDE